MPQLVKNLLAMQEIQVQSLGQEDPLEKGKATHFSILAWRVPWTKEPVGYSPWGPKESGTTERPTSSLAPATRSEVCHHVLPCHPQYMVECGSRTFLQTGKIPHL